MTNLPVTPAPVKEVVENVVENWNEQKAKLKAKFPNLTDDDLKFEEGKKDEMMKKISDKLGKTKEEFAALIAGLK